MGPANKRLMLHYAFLVLLHRRDAQAGVERPKSGTARLPRSRSLAALPSAEAWLFAVRLNAETTESNGSSSMAAVCAGSMALMDAGVPIGEHVGAISIGLVTETDADGAVAATRCSRTSWAWRTCSGTWTSRSPARVPGSRAFSSIASPREFPDDPHRGARVAKRARAKVIDAMEAAIRARGAPTWARFENSPRFHAMDIDVALIGKLIGTGRKTIKEIQSTTGATISGISRPRGPRAVAAGASASSRRTKALDLAVERVGAIATPLAVGAVVEAVVIDVKPFGWILRTPGLDEGMMHVTEYQWDAARIETRDFLPLGSTVAVKVTENGPGGTEMRASKPPSPEGRARRRGAGGDLPRPRAPLGRAAGQKRGPWARRERERRRRVRAEPGRHAQTAA